MGIDRATARGVRVCTAAASAVLVVGLLGPVLAGAATVPSAPRSLTAVAGPAVGQVALSWTAPSSSGSSPILDYGFDRSIDGGTTWSATTWFGGSALSASNIR